VVVAVIVLRADIVIIADRLRLHLNKRGTVGLEVADLAGFIGVSLSRYDTTFAKPANR